MYNNAVAAERRPLLSGGTLSFVLSVYPSLRVFCRPHRLSSSQDEFLGGGMARRRGRTKRKRVCARARTLASSLAHTQNVCGRRACARALAA